MEKLEEIKNMLEKKYSASKVKDSNLKIKIAEICLKLIERTKKEKKAMMETAYLITGAFIWYDFGDELNDAFEIAGKLEIPEENTLELWSKMEKILRKYIQKTL